MNGWSQMASPVRKPLGAFRVRCQHCHELELRPAPERRAAHPQPRKRLPTASEQAGRATPLGRFVTPLETGALADFRPINDPDGW